MNVKKFFVLSISGLSLLLTACGKGHAPQGSAAATQVIPEAIQKLAVTEISEKSDEVVTKSDLEQMTGTEIQNIYVAENVDFDVNLKLTNEEQSRIYLTMIKKMADGKVYYFAKFFSEDGEKSNTHIFALPSGLGDNIKTVAAKATTTVFGLSLGSDEIVKSTDKKMALLKGEKNRAGEFYIKLLGNDNNFLKEVTLFKSLSYGHDTTKLRLKKNAVTRDILLDRCLTSMADFGQKTDYSVLRLQQKGEIKIGKYIVDVMTVAVAKTSADHTRFQTIALVTSDKNHVSACLTDDQKLNVSLSQMTGEVTLDGVLEGEDGHSLGFGGTMVSGAFEFSNNIFHRSAKIKAESLSGVLSINRNASTVAWTSH